jgi:hypothetical protein
MLPLGAKLKTGHGICDPLDFSFRDLETYKALINVLPKGQYVPENLWQADFKHYPKQQDCIVQVPVLPNTIFPILQTVVRFSHNYERWDFP